MLLFDAHLDLAMNAMEWNRDLRWPVDRIRESEKGMSDKPDRGQGTVCFPEMRRGNIGICVATLIARYVKPSNPLAGWRSPEQAWAQTQGQLAWYRAMEEAGELVPITNRAKLKAHAKLWKESPSDPHPIGYILSLEGADSILSPAHLEQAYSQGLRAIGPAHYGPGTYAQGTNAQGGIGQRGRELLAEMERLGIILDATHLCDDSFWEALDHFGGPVWASHSNCRALVPHNRQFSDQQIRELIQRGAVIGAVLDAWMLFPGWVRGKTTPQKAGLTLDTVAHHIDRVCQIAGNSNHAGIGSDLDGAFGREQSPADLETIADLPKILDHLAARGYSQDDLQNIAHRNFIGFSERAWSKT